MPIKVIFVGDGSYDIYVKAFYNAAQKKQGIKAILYDYGDMNICAVANRDVIKRAEYHLGFGVDVSKINQKLLKTIREERIDIVFLYSAELIYASTVKKINQMGVYIAVYHNDNPFSRHVSRIRYRHFVKAVKYCDVAYAYRNQNIEDYKKAGANKAELLRSYYIDERNYYIDDNELDLEVPDVCYLGHFEEDGRNSYLEAAIKQGIIIGVPEYWKTLGINNDSLTYISDSHTKYNDILNKTKIAIVFLSSKNEDTYTRRCFEIPVTKTLMLAPYTDDMASLFCEGKEAVFYRNEQDFVNKIKYYLYHEDERLKIAEAGYDRVKRDGHEAGDRVNKIISDYKEIKGL